MSALKTSLPLFQTSSLSSSSSSSSYANTNTYVPLTSTSNKNNNNGHHTPTPSSYSYRSTSTPVSESSTPYAMSSSTYRSSGTSLTKPSFFHQTREKEKLELSTLNDKFADYVEKVRYLEAQNKKVQMETGLLTEKQQGHCQRIKSIFESEMAQIKEVVEKLFKDKNTLVYATKEAQVSLSSIPMDQIVGRDPSFLERSESAQTTSQSNVQRMRFFEVRDGESRAATVISRRRHHDV